MMLAQCSYGKSNFFYLLDTLILYHIIDNPMTKFSEYAKSGDSKSLSLLGDKPFSIVASEASDYTENGNVTQGVKITTKESFDIDGTQVNKFHTTRVAIVSKVSPVDKDGKPANQKLLADLEKEPLGPVKMIESISGNGRKFFELVDA